MVLGLSVTPSTVGFVLVEGQGADGVTLDSDTFDVRGGEVTAVTVSQHVATAMLRAEAVAAAGDHRLLSIGVTWSDDADWEGSVLLESLVESGIDNVLAVGLPEATEALARAIRHIVGYDKIAVCLVEPGAVLALEVDGRRRTVKTVVNRVLGSKAGLVDWLTSTLHRPDWQPDGLVLVGSAVDIDAITAPLRNALSIPVIAPAEADLALARGAALASAQNVEWTDLDLPATPVDAERRRRMPLPYVGAMTMLVAGALTFVVSVSLAVGLELTSKSTAKPADQAHVATMSVTPPIVQAGAPPAPPPIAEVPPPAADPPPAQDAPPVADVPDAPPEQAASDDPPAGPASADVPAPPAAAPAPAVPPSATDTVPPVQTGSGSWGDHSPLLTKILEHIPGLHKPPSEQTPDTTDQVPPTTDTPPPAPGG